MLNGLDVDLLFTGELSHHEALAATEQGRCVITAFHSNSERGYLFFKMKRALEEKVKMEVAELASTDRWEEGLDTAFKIEISQVDRDPFEIKTAANLEGW